MIKYKFWIVRFLVSFTIGVASYWLTVVLPQPLVYEGIYVGDIGPVLLGFLSWQQWRDGYVYLYHSGHPITGYPFTAMLLVSPLTLIPMTQALPVFIALSSGLLSWAILRYDAFWRLLIFFSFPYYASVLSGQWAPLFIAALLMPTLLPIAVAKPQLGIVLLAAGKWKFRHVITSLAIVLLSFLLYPNWIVDWLTKGNLIAYTQWLPIFIGPGVILALAVYRIRSRKGRLLLSMALIPQRLWYDQLLLFLIPNSRIEMLWLVINSWLAVGISLYANWIIDLAQQPTATKIVVVLLLYLPSLYMVLSQR